MISRVGHQTTISHMLRHSYVKHYDAVIKYYEMGTKVQLGPEQESYVSILPLIFLSFSVAILL